MAYVSKEDSQTARKIANKIGKKYGYKFSVSMRNHSTLNISLMSGKKIKLEDLEIKKYMYNFIESHGLGVFEYEDLEEFTQWYSQYLSGCDYHQEWCKYSQISNLILNGHDNSLFHFKKDSEISKMFREIETQIKKALNYFDDSDSMTDYFNTAFYYNENIGKWNKPYKVI